MKNEVIKIGELSTAVNPVLEQNQPVKVVNDGKSIQELVTRDLTTTSLALAELFGKRHDNVLRTIRNTIKDMSKEDRTLRKIEECFKINMLANNKKEPYFILGEEMTLVITGRFTGKNAFEVQMRLADAFIAMRNYIRNESHRELEKFQAVIEHQSSELQAVQKREPRDENSLAVILGIPSYYVQSEHDLLERHGYLTSKEFTQKFRVRMPTEKLVNICIGRKGNTLLYDNKIKELIRLLRETESLFD